MMTFTGIDLANQQDRSCIMVWLDCDCGEHSRAVLVVDGNEERAGAMTIDLARSAGWLVSDDGGVATCPSCAELYQKAGEAGAKAGKALRVALLERSTRPLPAPPTDEPGLDDGPEEW